MGDEKNTYLEVRVVIFENLENSSDRKNQEKVIGGMVFNDEYSWNEFRELINFDDKKLSNGKSKFGFVAATHKITTLRGKVKG